MSDTMDACPRCGAEGGHLVFCVRKTAGGSPPIGKPTYDVLLREIHQDEEAGRITSARADELEADLERDVAATFGVPPVLLGESALVSAADRAYERLTPEQKAIVDEAHRQVEEGALADDAVCAYCGSTRLASIEKTIVWREVQYVLEAEGFTTDDGTWGDDGDGDGETIGVACHQCSMETYYDDNEKDPRWIQGAALNSRAIVRRADWEAKHPIVEWTAERERLVAGACPHPGDHKFDIQAAYGTPRDPSGCAHCIGTPERCHCGQTTDRDQVTVLARIGWEAEERASQAGMQDGSYPWRSQKAVLSNPTIQAEG